MRVLITGGSGFIGSHLADRLTSRGDEVLAIDNFATGRRDNLRSDTPGLTVLEGSIADDGFVRSAFGDFRPDLVVHAAASYKDPDDWHQDAMTNVVGSANVARASVDTGVSRIVYFQTSLCYGLDPIEQPITVDHPLDPGNSSYAISKTAGEQYLWLTGLDVVSFRLANAYGPRNLSGPLPTFFHRLTEGKPCFVVDTRRDFIFVSDLVDVVERAVDGAGGRGVYHISSGSDYAIEELFEATTKAMGIELDEPVEVRPRGEDDAATILLDPSKTERDFSWHATTPLEPGVAAAVAYYREYGVAETFTHLKMADDPSGPPRA